jgi:two-component system, OmpR family, response regulator PhoP
VTQQPEVTQQPVQQRRALIVEDYDELRELLAEGLRRAGYHVDGAASLAEALGLAPERYDVLITDMSLGDAFGTELLEEVRVRDPERSCHCLLMTGGGLGPKPPPGVPVLVKPFRIEALVAAIERLLDEDGISA